MIVPLLLNAALALALGAERRFVDDLVLGVGVWLLARSLFRDPRTVFFVTAAALGSTLWEGQFRIFHALPLLLYLARRFLETGSPLLLFGTLTAASLQAFNGPPGLFFLTPLAAALVLRKASVRWTRAHAAALAGGFAVAVGVALLIGRRVSIPQDPIPWSQAALGFLRLDAGLYCGVFTLGFAVLGFDRRVFIGVGIALLLGLLAATSYTLLPQLHSGAPFPVTVPLLRLLLIFMAGAGFESGSRKTSILGGVFLVAAAALLVPSTEPLDTLALWAAIAAGVFFLLGSRPRALPLAMALILFLHPLDVFSWKFRNAWQRPVKEAGSR